MSLQPINSPTTWKRAQTSINANFTALVNALAGEGTVDATDPAVTALLTDTGSGAYAAVEGIVEDVADAVIEDNVTTPGTATHTALSSTYETQTRANDRAILVSSYGPLGTGDDSATITAALAAASGRRVVFPPNATLSTGANALHNASHTVIDGNGTTLQLIATGSRISALRLTGTCEDVVIQRLNVRGNANVTDAHAGITASGADLTDITIERCVVEDVTLGISLQADGSGSINGALLLNNTVRNVVGTSSGYGYGLHLSSSSTTVPCNVRGIGNYVESAQRHSLYCAKAFGATWIGNQFLNHRDANKTDSVLPAVVISRSQDVAFIGNTIQKPAGGGLLIGGWNPATYSGRYEVIGNTITDPQDAAALVYVGQQGPDVEGYPQHLDFAHNTLSSATTTAGLMHIWNGKVLNLRQNIFRYPGDSSGQTALMLFGLGQTTNEYMDDVAIEQNTFDIGANVAIRFANGHEAHTTKYRFRGNRRTTSNNLFTLSAALSNPNVDIQDQVRTGISFAGGAGALPAMINGPASTTAPSAGSAGALPAQPQGYLTVVINGVNRVIPYYTP